MSDETLPPAGVPMLDGTDSDLDATLDVALELLSPSDLLSHLDRHRPYAGQPWTCEGDHAAARLDGITLRDVYDAVIVAIFRSSGLPPEKYPASVYTLDLASMDAIAIAQNAAVVIALRAGWPSYQGAPPSRCVFCGDEWPDLCPPSLHERGDQYAGGSPPEPTS